MNKKYSKDDLLMVIIITFILAYIVSVIINVTFVSSHYKENAIKHGCAQYNATTAEFEWLDNPVDLISKGVGE